MAHRFFFILLVLSVITCRAQEVKKFSLKDAQEYAVKNNYTILNAKKDIDIARKKVMETTAIGLPQVSASVSYNNFLDIPTTLIPDFLSPAIIGVNESVFGLEPVVPVSDEPQFFEAKFGVQHNLTWGASLSQLLFNGQYIVGLEASRAYVDVSRANLKKSETDIRAEVTKTYHSILVLKENIYILDSLRVNLDKMHSEMEELHKQGFIRETDVEQVEIMRSNADAMLNNLNSQLEVAVSFLKISIGMGSSEQIELTDPLSLHIADLQVEPLMTSSFDPLQNIDFRLLVNAERLLVLNKKRAQSEYLPTLAGFYSFQKNAMRENFNFLDSGEPWFPSQIIGLQLDIPIFSSGGRMFRVQQARLEVDKIRTTQDQVRENLNLAVKSERSALNYAWQNYLNRRKSLQLASKIYRNVQISHDQGMSGSLDLLQTFNQYITAQSDYYSSVLEVLNKKTDLEKLLSKTN